MSEGGRRTRSSQRVGRRERRAHADVEDSCVLWTDAVQRAVLKEWAPEELLGEDHLFAGLDLLPEERRDFWARAVGESTGVEPWRIGGWSYTVTTLKAAWAAVTWSQGAGGASAATSAEERLRRGLEAADLEALARRIAENALPG